MRADLSFVWFAGVHAIWTIFFSRLFRKRSIIIASGYSVANMPEINYGLMISPKSARKAKYVLENVDIVLAVSNFNKCEILRYTHPKKVTVVYHGFDQSKFRPMGEKNDIGVSVGGVKKLNL